MASGKDEYVPAQQGRGFTTGVSKRPKEHEDNAQFMNRLMSFSRVGPIMHLFILDSLSKAANKVADMPYEEFEQKFGSAASIISPMAWHQCAKELQEEFKERGL